MNEIKLAAVARELEAHVAAAGWDQPAQLYALVFTGELLAAEPELASQLGDSAPDAYTPIEQELEPGITIEEQLAGIYWPAEVAGCAAVLERLVLPNASVEVPTDPAAAAEFVAAHPERQEVRMVAAVDRSGASYCAIRMRAHDEDAAVVTGPDLVPQLVELLQHTLQEVADD